jgi:hypothetical protein
MGPVELGEVQRMIAEGTLNAKTVLVWRQGMADWLPAGQVPEFMPSEQEEEAVEGSGAPLSPGTAVPGAFSDADERRAMMGEGELEEIEPGSAVIDVGACISRGFELTKRHFGLLCLVGVIYVGIWMGLSLMTGLLDMALGIKAAGFEFDSDTGRFVTTPAVRASNPASNLLSLVVHIAQNVGGVFLSLGITRIALNLVSGKPAEVGMLFGEGSKLLRAVGAGILYGLMVFLGLICFILPGIYLALRFGRYQVAIVDRNLGVFDSFAYSSSITTNNRMQLFGLAILGFLIMVAGMLALCVGMFFAYPIVALAWTVAYRWMQYGSAVARDAPTS